MRLEWDFKEVFDFADRLATISEFDKHLGKAAQQIAKVLHDMLIIETPVDFGTLQTGWKTEENYSYLIVQVENGYEVNLINRTLYAVWVNDGHKQRPGRFIPGYKVGDRFRYDPSSDDGIMLKKSWVDGRFFVERSILEVANTTQVEKFIYKELNNWFRWCVNGK
jgi:hypothetical protein